MKRTNIVLDEKLVSKIKTITGMRVTRQVVNYALKELLRHKRQREILKLQGTIDWEGDLSAMRQHRVFQ